MSPQNGVIVLTFLVSDVKMSFKKRLFVEGSTWKNDGNIFYNMERFQPLFTGSCVMSSCLGKR